MVLAGIALTPSKVQSMEVNQPEEPSILSPKSYTIESFKLFAEQVAIHEWGEEHVKSFLYIINKESSWVYNENHYPLVNGKRKSSAYGFGGFLDATWGNVGCVKTSDQYIQIVCMARYITDRYGDPNKSKIWHIKNNWY